MKQYEYDALNRLIRIFPADDPNKTETPILMEYLDGQLKKVTDRKNQATTFTYDAGHRQTKIAYADTSFEEFTYNAASQLISRKKQDGNVINFTYDELGRRTGIDYPAGTDPVFAYDAASRRTQMTDGTGSYTYTYDDAGRLTSVTYPGGKVVSYTFDVIGQRTTMTLSGYGTTTYLYYDNGSLASFTTPDGKTFSYQYNRNGAVTQQINGNNTKAEYVYNSRGQLTHLVNKKSDNTVLSSFAYTLDNAGNRVAMVEQDGAQTTWSYDDLYQLTREVKRDGGGVVIHDTSYTYDLAQNRTSMTNHLTGTTTSYTYNAMNQMLTAGNMSFTYDANGNTVSKQANQQTTTYTWDYENKLTRIDYPNGSSNVFSTNADGQRMTANDSGGNRRFIYDGTNVVGEQDIASGNLIAVYDYGNSGLARQVRGTGASYYQFDGLGSTRQLTDGNQAVTDTVSYDAWGNVLSSSGTTANGFKYVGRLGYYADADNGLMLLEARYYGAGVGRFWSVDPARDGYNWYLYASNVPTILVDPDGLAACARQPAPPNASRCGPWKIVRRARVTRMALELGDDCTGPGGKRGRWARWVLLTQKRYFCVRQCWDKKGYVFTQTVQAPDQWFHRYVGGRFCLVAGSSPSPPPGSPPPVPPGTVLPPPFTPPPPRPLPQPPEASPPLLT